MITLDPGERFPFGGFVAEDSNNRDLRENQDLDLVPRERIADLLGLLEDATHE